MAIKLSKKARAEANKAKLANHERTIALGIVAKIIARFNEQSANFEGEEEVAKLFTGIRGIIGSFLEKGIITPEDIAEIASNDKFADRYAPVGVASLILYACGWVVSFENVEIQKNWERCTGQYSH